MGSHTVVSHAGARLDRFGDDGAGEGQERDQGLNPSLIPPSRLARVTILSTQRDERLVELVRQGSPAAFEAIVHRYRRALVRHCARILGEADAEEAVQDALVNAHGALVSGSEVRSLGAWLHAVAHNAAVAMLRRRAARPECPERDCAHRAVEPSPEPSRAQLQDLVRALRSLPPRQRDAIVMRELEGRSYDEIGVRLGASDGAVRQLLNRVRRSIRASLGALVPAAPLLRWTLAANDGCGAASALTLAGGSALASKLAGAAIISAVSVVALLPSPYAPFADGRDRRPLGRAASVAALSTDAGSQSRPAYWMPTARSGSSGRVTPAAASSALQPLGQTARPVRPGGSGQPSFSGKSGAGGQDPARGAGSHGCVGTGALWSRRGDAPTGSSAAWTGEPGVRGQSSGGRGQPGQQAGAYRADATSPSQQRPDRSPVSVGQIAPRAG
jgi:RNA polymerase sigma factor (sigma-70 family)